MTSGKVGLIIGVVVVVATIALIAAFEFGASSARNATSKLPYSYVPLCASHNNCTSSSCPEGSYFNSSLGYCYWNYSIGDQCPPGAVYQNNQNCHAEGAALNASDRCVAGYIYDEQNGLCEPSPQFCQRGYFLSRTNNGTPECLLSSACSNGYNLTFNKSVNNFLCIR